MGRGRRWWGSWGCGGTGGVSVPAPPDLLLGDGKGVYGPEEVGVDIVAVMLVAVFAGVCDGKVVLQAAVGIAAVDVVDVGVAPLDEEPLVLVWPASNEGEAVPRLLVVLAVSDRVADVCPGADLYPRRALEGVPRVDAHQAVLCRHPEVASCKVVTEDVVEAVHQPGHPGVGGVGPVVLDGLCHGVTLALLDEGAAALLAVGDDSAGKEDLQGAHSDSLPSPGRPGCRVDVQVLLG